MLRSAEPPILVFYYQLTIGAAHLARVRALSHLPEIECMGVQLAAEEQTRSYNRQKPANDEPVVVLMQGIYEETSLWKRAAAAKSTCRPSASRKTDRRSAEILRMPPRLNQVSLKFARNETGASSSSDASFVSRTWPVSLRPTVDMPKEEVSGPSS